MESGSRSPFCFQVVLDWGLGVTSGPALLGCRLIPASPVHAPGPIRELAGGGFF